MINCVFFSLRFSLIACGWTRKKFSIIDDYKFNGDLLEAQMFAYIGVRSIKKLIISSKSTTGVKKSISGGKLYKFNY